MTKSYILFVYKTSLPTWRIGITVTRKIGTAVLRNRFKRLVRAFFYKYALSWQEGYDFVLLSRIPLDKKNLVLSAIEDEILPILQTKYYIGS